MNDLTTCDLYRAGRHEYRRRDGLIVAFGNDHVCGPFVQVWNPTDCEELAVDVDGMFDGEQTVVMAFAQWVLLE